MSAETTATLTALPTGGTYRLAPTMSTAGFVVSGLFGLLKVRGTIPIRAGTVEITDGQAMVSAELDPAGIATGIRKRDKDLRSARFLDVAAFPSIRFEGEVLEDLSAVHGWLTVHGDTVGTTLEVRSVRPAEDRIEVVAAVRLDRTRFGITAARGMIPRHLNVELSVTLFTAR